MYSMTGYGKGEYRENGVELTVEVRSVNNRYLDVAVKCPRAFLSEEENIRALVRESLSRGHIDVFVNFTDGREQEKSLFLDKNIARSYYAVKEELLKEFPKLSDDANVSFFMRLPDVVRPMEAGGADDVLKAALKTALKSALEAHAAMRKAEGERLKEDLIAHMKVIERLRGEIAERAPAIAEEYRKKLTERISDFLGGKVDETRILTEAALFADKCSIDEELTRLSSHITEFYAICKSDRVGRKLDFLIQEFNRECNTVCSKSNDGKITACALEMKNEIEKVREQVQNLE